MFTHLSLYAFLTWHGLDNILKQFKLVQPFYIFLKVIKNVFCTIIPPWEKKKQTNKNNSLRESRA